MKWMVLALGVWAAVAVQAKQYRESEGAYRTFTAGEREIAGRVVSVDIGRGTVTLELENKQRKSVKIGIFSPNDRNYIQEHAMLQEFKSPRFKIEMEKSVVDKRREQPSAGIRRDVEVLQYDIKVSNNTSMEMKGVVIAYNIFLEQEHLGEGQNDTQRYYVDGTLKLEPLAPRAKKLVSTDTYEIYSQKLAGGYDGYVSGAPTHQSGKSKGVWLKVLLKTPSGLTATRDICLPKNTSDIFNWHKPEKKDAEK